MNRILGMELGALTLACVIAAVFFVRYWSNTRDRFFLWFAAAFTTFAVNWVLIGFGVGGENTHFVFVVRLAGFLMIIAAIVGKNAAPKD
jgi:hypothetical protein